MSLGPSMGRALRAAGLAPVRGFLLLQKPPAPTNAWFWGCGSGLGREEGSDGAYESCDYDEGGRKEVAQHTSLQFLHVV